VANSYRPPTGNTVIESLGMYLPAGVRDTKSIVADCRAEVGVPLEHLTGIQSRRVVGPDEYSIDLARLAIGDCFAKSSYHPADIDLVIACNVSRCDGPDHKFSFEPSTAARLRHQCGLENALAFDVSNACAGMFTGIALADGFLKTGRARTAMVVSGEYASHLIDTAQKEIEGPMDPRMACLTVGDAGAAVILEGSSSKLVGFHDIDLATLGRYSSLCIGKLTDQPHGGATMAVDAIGVTSVTVRHLVPFVDTIMRRNNWRPDHCDHIIIHQTSEASLRDGMTTFNRIYGAQVTHRGNTIHNLRERGNTVSTTHFVALADNIQANRIQSGDTVVFAISGSGQTLGGALYALDDLPDRLRRRSNGHISGRTAAPAGPKSELATHVHVSSVGIAAQRSSPVRSVQKAMEAARSCLESSPLASSQLGLIVHTGVYRDDYIAEPAVAAFIADELGVTAEVTSTKDPKTLAFDLLNGGLGFLDACYAAIQMISAGKTEHVMIVASEVENNSIEGGHQRYGMHETGSAVILSRSGDLKGFGGFVFHHHGQHNDSLSTYTKYVDGETWLEIDRADDLTALYMTYIPPAVDELLAAEQVDRSTIAVVLPPFLPAAERNLLAKRLGIPSERFADAPSNAELFTSSIPYWFDYLENNQLVHTGDVGLIITTGSGIQIGCATYRF
jgi:3-oxoacyl-[acyl-carrier-protein] synthase III